MAIGEITKRSVIQQLSAMGCQNYEVLILNPKYQDKITHEVREMPALRPRANEKPWDGEQILKVLPMLRGKNSEGCHIYIRPAGTHHLTLIDDVNKDAIERMKQDGFSPALIIETSPKNFQVWLNHGTILSQAESTLAAKTLASRYNGDPSSADWRHLGRMAGFTNCKEKYRQENGLSPFCRLQEADGKIYPQAKNFVLEIKLKHQALQRKKAKEDRALSNRKQKTDTPFRKLKTIGNFRENLKYKGDLHVADAAYATYAIAHGIDETTIVDAIKSRDLSHKGNEKRIEEYVGRTIEGAYNWVKSNKERGL